MTAVLTNYWSKNNLSAGVTDMKMCDKENTDEQGAREKSRYHKRC